MSSESEVKLRDEKQPWDITTTVWNDFKPELDALGIVYPKWMGEKVLTFRVKLEAEPHPKYYHIFFLESKSGEVCVVGENVTFKTPQGLIDYFKSSECSPEHIKRKKEMEARLDNKDDE